MVVFAIGVCTGLVSSGSWGELDGSGLEGKPCLVSDPCHLSL